MENPRFVNSETLARLEGLGGPSLLRKTCDAFLESAPKRVWICCAYSGTEDLEDVEVAAEFLKNSSSDVGADQLRVLSEHMELAAEAGNKEEVERLGLEIADAFIRTAEILNFEKLRRMANAADGDSESGKTEGQVQLEKSD